MSTKSPDLVILTPTVDGRQDYLHRMMVAIQNQIVSEKANAIVITNHDQGEKNGGKTTGAKRNELIAAAVKVGAKYGAFFDDDDLPGPTYIRSMMQGIEKGVDVCSLKGQIYWSGKKGKPFLHSLEYKDWFEDDKFYYRCPNHLNCFKLDLVKDIPFPDQGFGEDGKWSFALRDAGVFKTEHIIDDVIYHYFCGDPKHDLEAMSVKP